MRTLLVATAIALVTVCAGDAWAKCYHFGDTPSDVYVCVGKNGSDSFADRKTARGICSKALGKKCGNVSSHSSSCHSNSGRCYDENGKAHRSLKGY